MTSPTFSSLGLTEAAASLLTKAGFQNPTPIQEKAIPVALTGVDVIGCASTGTGKTAAFLLPMIERLCGKDGPRGLVLAPTRELATQISEQFQRFGAPRGLRQALLMGGVSKRPQTDALRQGAHVLIATPGRLIDHMDEKMARLDGMEVVVLDEADRMLDMGFKPQLTRILKALPKKRQTMLFSATMGKEVSDFAKSHLHAPVQVEINRSGTTAQRASQEVFSVEAHEKTPLLLSLLETQPGSTLVFTRTKHRADKVAKQLARYHISTARLHSDRSQAQRLAALEGFRRGQFRVLVATDIAARGIDVAEISHVVNYDIPFEPEDYVHRIGRTARASHSGHASSFCSKEEVPQWRQIEKLLGKAVPKAEVPKDSAIFQTELKAAAERQRNPGPRQPGHGKGQGQRRPKPSPRRR